MKGTKRFISTLLALLVVIALLPWAVNADAEGELSNEYRVYTEGSYAYNLPLGVTAAEFTASVYATAALSTAAGDAVDKSSDTVICTGMVLSYTYADYTLVVNGDLNGDGVCTAADYLLVEKYILGGSLGDMQMLAGDLDGDGIVATTDALMMERYILGLGRLDGNCYLTDEEKANVVLTNPNAPEENLATIHFEGDTVTATGSGVQVIDNYAYVTASGNYTVTGQTDNGYIHVCAGAEEPVTLTLSGVKIGNSAGPAIYFEQCKSANVLLADGTASTLSDGTATTLLDKGALFANDSLVISGGGTLAVTGNRQHGIVSDDDIIIDGATVTVTGAVKDALHANDDITVNGGSLTVSSAGSDAVESEGTVNVNGGTLTLTADAGTALKAGTVFTATDGKITVISCADGIKAGTELHIDGGNIGISALDNAIKAVTLTDISGGTVNVLASDTGVKGDTKVNISGGTLTLNSTNNAIKSDLLVDISGGDITLLSTGDGIKASSIDTTAAADVRATYTYDSLNGSIETSGCYVWNSGSVSESAIYWFAALASSNGDGTYIVKQTIASGTAKTFTATADDIVLLTHVDSAYYSTACLVQVDDVITYDTATNTVTATIATSYLGDINVLGGNLYIEAAYDATQAGETLTVNNTTAPKTSASGIGTSGDYNIYMVSGGGASASFDSTAGSYKALKADNYIYINNGYIYASSPEDTVRSDDYIEINGGTMVIESGRDGVAAVGGLYITGGSLDITTGSGYSGTISSTDTNSYKALKGTGYIAISGGTFNLNSMDDAVHSNGTCAIEGGTFTIYTGDDAFHSDTTMTVTGGEIDILSSYEGVEGLNVNISGGRIHIESSDDGINAAGGADGSGTGTPTRPGWGGMGSSSSSSQYSLTISGTAFVWMNAKGDGADSNGSLTVSGGTLIVQQSQTNENSGIDADGTIKISGGVVVVVDGGNSMNSLSTSNFTQNGVKASISGSANSLIALTDSSGNLLLAFKPTVSYSRLIISTPELTTGASYKIYTGGSCTGTATENLYESGTYSGGTQKKSFTVSSTLTSA